MNRRSFLGRLGIIALAGRLLLEELPKLKPEIRWEDAPYERAFMFEDGAFVYEPFPRRFVREDGVYREVFPEPDSMPAFYSMEKDGPVEVKIIMDNHSAKA